MKLLIAASLCFFVVAAEAGLAEVAFPKARNAVGPDEYYVLEQFGDWTAKCLKSEDSEDICQTSRSFSAIDESLSLFFSVVPYVGMQSDISVDVDLLPRALLAIQPYSSSDHYDDFSAAVTALDGEPFDGYWCPLTDLDSCSRGPELTSFQLEFLLSAKEATVTIYSGRSASEESEIAENVKIDLGRLTQSVDRAEQFNSEIYGVSDGANIIDIEMCDLFLNGQQKRVSYSLDPDFDVDHTSLREIVRGARGGGSCPSYVTLAYLTPGMSPAQREMFCLVYDRESDKITGFQQGERDAYRVCKSPSQSFCERVNATKDAAVAVTGVAAGAVGGAVGATTVTGTTVVMHSSGAAIITGSAGYVAGTLGTLGTTLLGIVTAPVTATAAAVSVVAVGGAIYVCG